MYEPYATPTAEAQLDKLINGRIKTSRMWQVDERQDHRNVIVTFLPTNQRMLAVAYDPFKYTINLPSVGNV